NDPEKPSLQALPENTVLAKHSKLGNYFLHADGTPSFLFCENETNARRLFGMQDAKGYFKDAFHELLIQGNITAVNPAGTGTKCAGHYPLTVPARGEMNVRLRLASRLETSPFAGFDTVINNRRQEANEFYAGLQEELDDPDSEAIQRQALAGM